MPLFGPNISTMKDKHDLAGLLHALKGKDARTRREAIKALGELGARSAVPALVEILLADQNDVAEKAESAEALGKIADAAAIEPLVKANEISKERERALIDMAIATPDRRYRAEFYVNRIATDEYLLRGAIANALARIGGTRAVQALFEMLATEAGRMESSVKSAIKDAIGGALRKGDAEFVPRLCDALKHKSEEVRACAADCLGGFSAAQAVEALLDVACDEDETFSARAEALASLGQIGDRSVLPHLEDVMRAGNRVLARDAEHSATQIRQRYPLPLFEDAGA